MKSIPKKSLKRLASYHYYLKNLKAKRRDFVSNERLASDLKISISNIRHDLENLNDSLSISEIHNVDHLLNVIETQLGYKEQKYKAVLAGAGNLGHALLNYDGFEDYGLKIVAAFDSDPKAAGKKVSGIEILAADKMEDLIKRMHISIGIITAPPETAQQIADAMVEGGVKGIWNFTVAVLKVPEDVVVRSTALYNDFIRIAQELKEKDTK